MSVDIINYGCTIMCINVPDRFGIKKNVVAGFDNLKQYTEQHPYFGATIGRFANRIAFGKFNLDGVEYSLSVNDPPNHLHGGFVGFDKKVWDVVDTITESNKAGIMMRCKSRDGEEGYPGNLETMVTFFLTDENKLSLHYYATTDKPTIVNLTNHSYFNLAAFEEETIYNHLLKIQADSYLLKNENSVPAGDIQSVKNGVFDFTSEKKIGEHINIIPNEKGYDHTFVLKKDDCKDDYEIALTAELHDPRSGRILKVFTDQPGLHIYTANWWDGSLQHANGTRFQKHGAVAFEAQGFPDAPNHSNFPDTLLRPGKVYEASTVFQFLIDGCV